MSSIDKNWDTRSDIDKQLVLLDVLGRLRLGLPTILQHLIDTFHALAVHPISVMTKTASKVSRNVKQFVNQHFIFLLLTENIKAF